MKTSTPEQPKQNAPKSILLIGPPGGGKTTLAMQFPGVWIADCDENLDGPELHARNVDRTLSYKYTTIRLGPNGKPMDTADCLPLLLDSIDEAGKDPTVKTVVIDSLTAVNEFIIRWILKRQSRTEMEARDWIPFKSQFYNLIFTKLRSLGRTTICTCHESKVWAKPDKQNLMHPELIGYDPSVQGSIVDYFGAFFTDMWRCESRPAPFGKQTFVIVAAKTTKSDLKSSCGIPGEVTVPEGKSGFAVLNQWLKI